MEYMKNKKVVKQKKDCVILRVYHTVYECFCYYLFTVEGEIICQDLRGGTRIPSGIKERFDNFSLEEWHKEERKRFVEYLAKEGYEGYEVESD